MVPQRTHDDIVLLVDREGASQGRARRHGQHRSEYPRRSRAKRRQQADVGWEAVNGSCTAIKHLGEAG
jgi:hypothetical protein